MNPDKIREKIMKERLQVYVGPEIKKYSFLPNVI